MCSGGGKAKNGIRWECINATEEKDQNQAKKKEKVKYYSKVESRRQIGVSSTKRRGAWRRVALNSRNGLRRKVNQSHLFVMNLIWLMLFITHGGLILILQFMFRIHFIF